MSPFACSSENVARTRKQDAQRGANAGRQDWSRVVVTMVTLWRQELRVFWFRRDRKKARIMLIWALSATKRRAPSSKGYLGIITGLRSC